METHALPSTLPLPLQRVHLCHLTLSPTTSSSLLSRIVSASLLPPSDPTFDSERAALDYAFLDPTKVCSRSHVLAAVTQAAIVAARGYQDGTREGIRAWKQGGAGGMKTKTPHSEVIFMLNLGNNVGESLKRFGLSSNSTSLLLVKFTPPSVSPSQVLSKIRQLLPDARFTLSPAPERDPETGSESGDIDLAIRYNSPTPPPTPALTSTVTDWPSLNKYYKLGIPQHDLKALASGEEKQRRKWEAIVVSSVALKCVAS